MTHTKAIQEAEQGGQPIPNRDIRAAEPRVLARWLLWTCEMNARKIVAGKALSFYVTQTRSRILRELAARG